MNLIDILIENDIQWPNGADGVVQDQDGEVKFYTINHPILDDGVWLRGRYAYCHKSFYLQTASDYSTAMITKQEWESRKMNKAMFAGVKVGDKVWSITEGWGTIIDRFRSRAEYPLVVEFENREQKTYTLWGRLHIKDISPTLFWDEIEIKAPPKPLPKLEVDTNVVVWHNDGLKYHRHFSHFDKDGVLYSFVDGKTSFTCVADTTAWDNWMLAEHMI